MARVQDAQAFTTAQEDALEAFLTSLGLVATNTTWLRCEGRLVMAETIVRGDDGLPTARRTLHTWRRPHRP